MFKIFYLELRVLLYSSWTITLTLSASQNSTYHYMNNWRSTFVDSKQCRRFVRVYFEIEERRSQIIDVKSRYFVFIWDDDLNMLLICKGLWACFTVDCDFSSLPTLKTDLAVNRDELFFSCIRVVLPTQLILHTTRCKADTIYNPLTWMQLCTEGSVDIQHRLKMHLSLSQSAWVFPQT